MVGPDDPKNGDGRRRRKDPLPLGRIDRLILKCIVPKYRREEFIGDLLEEWETEILPELGEERARDWLRSQVRRSIIPWLTLRLDGMMRTVLGMVAGFLLFVYLLPGILVGLLLYGTGMIAWSVVNALRRANPSDRQPLRGIALFILNVVVPGHLRGELIDDLRFEYLIKISEIGPLKARRWLWGQVRRSITPCLLWRLERLIGFLRSKRFAGWAIRLALCVYVLPALIVVVAVSVLGIMVSWFLDLPRWPPGSGFVRKTRDLIRFTAKWIRRYFHRGIDRIGGDAFWRGGIRTDPRAAGARCVASGLFRMHDPREGPGPRESARLSDPSMVVRKAPMSGVSPS
jgi:hypothetical protein